VITRLYSQTLAIAAHRHAMAVMALISFAESSFLPLPPDVLLIPMILAQPRRAWLIATVCTISSVLGAYVGYAIGFFLFDTIGLRVLDFYHLMDKYEAFKAAFAQWGAWIIIIKGLTPIPFKLVTIASGAAQFNLSAFTLASLVSRGFRFFILAALLWRYGEPIRDFIERRLMLVTSLVAALLVGGVVVLRYL
jgi:membrane protein YqaA with SNARE-associated domain